MMWRNIRLELKRVYLTNLAPERRPSGWKEKTVGSKDGWEDLNRRSARLDSASLQFFPLIV